MPSAAPAPAAPTDALDARVALVLSLLFGLLVWRTGVPGMLGDVALFLAVLALRGRGRGEMARLAAAAAGFVLLWGGVKLVLEVVRGGAAGPALSAAAVLALRLVALLLLGAALNALVTPRALGVAGASLARPVLGRSAWSAALALSLMVHFVPRAVAAFAEARAALRVRRLRVSRLRALLLVLEIGTRKLAAATWNQTLAVAARRLDDPAAWRAPPLRARDVAVGIAVAALAVTLSRL